MYSDETKLNFFYRWGLPAIAFSIFGLLFVFNTTTLLPTLILIAGAASFLLDKVFRRSFMVLFSDSEIKWIAWPFLAWFCVEALLALIHSNGLIQGFPSNALRVLLSLTLLCLPIKDDLKRYFYWGLIIGAFAAALWGSFELVVLDDIERAQGTTNNPIHFGNLTALIALLCLSASILSQDLNIKFRTLLLFSMMFAIFASITSLTRSSVIISICALPLFFITRKDKYCQFAIKLIFIGIFISFLVVIFSNYVQERLRINEFMSAFAKPGEIDYTSLTSGRYGMWQTSLILFKEHPIIGVGSEGFTSSLETFIASGIVQGDPYSEIRHNQPHNDLLYSASTGGILKLMSYLALIFGPFLFFYRRYKKIEDDNQCRIIPFIGMQIVATYFLTGLTNSNFDLQIYSTTYAVLVCLLAKIAMKENSYFIDHVNSVRI